MKPTGKIAVTGASGFVGKRLVERLVRRGHAVTCLLRPSSSAHGLDRPGIEVKRGFLTDSLFLHASLAGCDAVIHCAAMVSDWGTVHEIRAANVTATQSLVKAAAQTGIGHFVHISTTDIYGHPGQAGISELHPPSQKFANWYSETKREAEYAVLGGTIAHTLIRPATVYGPGSKTLVGEIGKALQSGFMLLIDGGKPCAGLTYIDNLIDAIELALFNPRAYSEAFNVSDASAVTWAEFVDGIAQDLGVRYRKISLPYSVAFKLGHGLESSYRQLRRLTGCQVQALLSRQAVQVMGIPQDFSIEKAGSHLGFAPVVGFEEGIKKSVQWLRADFKKFE
ncbi:MAG: NAD-dependent epimerase/dehydratase family protein [Methylomonas sp.]|nr:NAD-dependent epimerase/dehydratase family protein [Methylomonas sp.]